METPVNLSTHGIEVLRAYRNAPTAVLYEHGVRYDHAEISSTGAMVADSGAKKGRSPLDKRIIADSALEKDIWWGKVNQRLPVNSYAAHRKQAVKYLNSCECLYVVDGLAGWDPKYQIKVRVICSRPYHALFMTNMLVVPDEQQLAEFGEPDLVIYNAGKAPADPEVEGGGTTTSVALNLSAGELVILGTEYAGEMKKGVFTVMHYLMPKVDVLSMHCSANQGECGDVSLFFGLSGTGKTTLSADPSRFLIGDDEHCWSQDGIFNIEGGCYAKCDHLNPQDEPLIYSAIRFGSVLENVAVNSQSRQPEYNDTTKTENTRASYPIEFIANAKSPCVAGHPKNIIFLTCDAFGVLPPVARLTPEQAMFHFMSGYTAKVAGTEEGVVKPEATFSACFGAPFLIWHPSKYAQLLADKMHAHEASAWLINTGWISGGYGEGRRVNLKYTRSIITAIHQGELNHAHTQLDPVFGFELPNAVANVPKEILIPRNTWKDPLAYDAAAANLANLFCENFRQFESSTDASICHAGPNVNSYLGQATT